MKSKTLLALITVIALSFTACGDKTETTSNANVNEPVVEATVSESQEVAAPTNTPTQESAIAPAENDAESQMAAFEAMMEGIANDPTAYEPKMLLWEFINEYNIMIMSGMSQEEALAQMPAHDDFTKAVISLISKHTEEIQAGFITEEGLWYTNDFDSLYEEFLSCQNAATAKIDTAEKAYTNLTISNNVIYNENGVSLTFDSFEDKNDTDNHVTMHLTLSNNNDSNKKVFFDIQNLYVNGVKIANRPLLDYVTESGVFVPFTELENGNTVQLQVGSITCDYLDNIYSKLGTGYMESPIETIQMDYMIQIGSNSESVYDSIVLQTANYNNDSFAALFGEHFTTLEVPNTTDSNTSVLETYGSFKDTFCVFAVRSETFENLRISQTNDLLMNGVELSNGKDYTMYELPDGALYIVNLSEDDIRKQCEIGNDEPLNVNLSINYIEYTIYTK